MTTLASSVSDATVWSVLTDDARVIINDRNMFIIQATVGFPVVRHIDPGLVAVGTVTNLLAYYATKIFTAVKKFVMRSP